MKNKKILTIIAIVVILGASLFILTGCGNSENNNNSNSTNNEKEKTVSEIALEKLQNGDYSDYAGIYQDIDDENYKMIIDSTGTTITIKQHNYSDSKISIQKDNLRILGIGYIQLYNLGDACGIYLYPAGLNGKVGGATNKINMDENKVRLHYLADRDEVHFLYKID